LSLKFGINLDINIFKMKNILFGIVSISIISLVSCSDNSKITTGTLLSDMINRELISEFPYPEYTTKQFSSYDRKSLAADKPDWFANADRSQFLRIEKNNGRREFVMLDADGPGAIVRLWITVAGYNGNGTLRVYLDGKEEPELEGEVLNMMSGGGFVDPPLASSVSELTDYNKRGHNLYFPIAYSKHCKITYESDGLTQEPGAEKGEAFYYNVNYRTYTDNVSLVSFTKKDLRTYADKIKEVQQQISGRTTIAEHGDKISEKNNISLEPEQSVSQQIEGQKAIKKFSIKLNAKNYEQALRSTVLEIKFDGEQTVWCPIGDFFGTGYKLSPYRTWYSEVTLDGTLTCLWLMPFSKSATVTIKNLGRQKVKLQKFVIETTTYNWTERSMHFGAGWFEQNRLESQTEGKNNLGEEHGHFDVNYVTLTGKGVLAGNGVTLFNTIDAWWGEGDEKIFVDNEVFPSHFGTGTEDFYGYAWSNPAKFDHPYIAQPDGSGAIDIGHVVNLRYRGLDIIPFQQKLRVDVEMWHWLKATINHAPVSYWYMIPGGRSNIKPSPSAARNKVALSKMDFFLDGYFDRNIFIKNIIVDIKGRENGYEIRYTLDGSEPSKTSKLYEGPFKLKESAVVKSVGFLPGGYTTEVLEGDFIKQSPLNSVRLTNPKAGLKYEYVKLDDMIESAKQLKGYKSTQSGSVASFKFPDLEYPGIFGLVVEGYIKVPVKGIYTLSTNTNDGSILYVHGERIVDNDGGHGARERKGQVALKPGFHPLRLEYFQMGGGKLLEVFIEGPEMEKHQFLTQELYH
jgi:hypothetical protein